MARSSADDPRLGTKIAERYRLDRVIGQGGMGTVFEGVHLWTSRPVAVKLLETDQSETMSRRILAEARAAAAVRHPHLVEVLDVGEVGPGLMYLVLELLEGETLWGHLKRKGRLRAEDALDVTVPILDALAALHEAKVIHRDVKPGNIFLSDDGAGRVVPKLLDLGISKRIDVDEALTVTGALMGTPSYMSPEQARGATSVGPAADIWAMGVVLFECLTGDRPFDHPTVPGLLHQIATERPVPVSTRAEGLPPAVASAVDRALAYDADDRHPSAKAMAEALVDAAMDAGWPLTCRIPAGPMISLVPDEPRDAAPVDPVAQTQASDADVDGAADPDETPHMTPSRTGPIPRTEPSRSRGASPPSSSPRTSEKPRIALRANDFASLPQETSDLSPRMTEPAPDAEPDPDQDPGPGPDPDPDPDPGPDPGPHPELAAELPADAPLPVTSRTGWIAAALAAVVVAALIGAWSYGRDEPRTTPPPPRAAAEPPPDPGPPPDPTVAADRVEPPTAQDPAPEPVAAPDPEPLDAPTPDRRRAAPPDPEPRAARRSAPRRAPPATPAPTPSPPPAEDPPPDPVREGPNRAPIILD